MGGGESASQLPSPPVGLVHRTGCLGEHASEPEYEQLSRGVREMICAMMPTDWTWSGKRVLDFGCGAGRVLRQFAPEAANAEFWGCDIHGPSIEWINDKLSPPFKAFQCSEHPGLPQSDGYFDLIYAISVYTHMTDNWAGWLLEHHRVLAKDGLLLASFLGEGMITKLIEEEWNEDRIGMNVLWAGKSWEAGGPIAFHSPWWLRAHWGRAFEVISLLPHVGDNTAEGHGLILLRRKSVQLTVADLERLEPGEDREIIALKHQSRQLQNETRALRAQNQRLQDSLSWRLTAPLRTAKRILAR